VSKTDQPFETGQG